MARRGTRLLAIVALSVVACAMSGGAKLALSADTDNQPPLILNFAIAPARVNTGIGPRDITVSAFLVDMGSGVSGSGDVSVQFRSPSGSHLVWATFYHDVPGKPDALVDGSVNYGLWEVLLTLPQGAEDGTWQLEDLFLVDQAGNHRVLVTNDMQAFGFATTIDVKNSSHTLCMPLILRKPAALTPTPSPMPTMPLGLPPVPPN